MTSLVEEAVGVDEDLVGLSKDLHAAISQAFGGGSHIIDAQIQETTRRACFKRKAELVTFYRDAMGLKLDHEDGDSGVTLLPSVKLEDWEPTGEAWTHLRAPDGNIYELVGSG